MSAYSFLFITQADGQEVASGDLSRLLDSIAAGSPAPRSACVVAVLRGVTDSVAEAIATGHATVDVRVVRVPRRTSLSACRNAGLRAAQPLLESDDLLVGFPDDDLWFPQNLLTEVTATFRTTGADVVCGRYAPDEQVVLPEVGIRPGWLTPAATAELSCNAFFMTAAIVRRVQLFNENIGAGTPIPAGEDLDFLLRSVAAGAQVWYSPALRLLHEWRVQPSYYAASTTVLAAHVLAGAPGLRTLLLRCVLHGFRAALNRSLPPTVLLELGRRVVGREWRAVRSGWPSPAGEGPSRLMDRAAGPERSGTGPVGSQGDEDCAAAVA